MNSRGCSIVGSIISALMAPLETIREYTEVVNYHRKQ